MILQFYHLSPPLSLLVSNSSYLFIQCQLLYTRSSIVHYTGFPSSLAGKESACNAGDHDLIPGSGRSTGKESGCPLQYSWASLVAQLVKNLPAVQGAWVQSLGWEDSPGEGNSYSLQYSGLENSMDCVIHGVAKSWT